MTRMATRIDTNKKIVEPELSYRLMGILFGVHSALGGRYQEKYYQRAVELALKQSNLKYDREVAVPLMYNGKKIGKYILDFLIEDKIILELKTVPFIQREDVLQVYRYLKSKGLPLGIVANFRGPRLTYRRIINVA